MAFDHFMILFLVFNFFPLSRPILEIGEFFQDLPNLVFLLKVLDHQKINSDSPCRPSLKLKAGILWLSHLAMQKYSSNVQIQSSYSNGHFL